MLCRIVFLQNKLSNKLNENDIQTNKNYIQGTTHKSRKHKNRLLKKTDKHLLQTSETYKQNQRIDLKALGDVETDLT